MSKMKRKWLRVIEYEETGRPLDVATRNSLLETHPDLPILHDENAMPENEAMQAYPMPPNGSMMAAPQAMMQPHHMHHDIPIEPQIDSQLEQQIQSEIASANGPRI